MADTAAMPLQQCHGLIARYFERAHFPASSCSCKQVFFLAYASAAWFWDHDRNSVKAWRWCNSCCLLLHGTCIRERTHQRWSEPLTLTNTLCICVTVSECLVTHPYCNICSPQNWVVGEQWFGLIDADGLLPLYGSYFEYSPAENTGPDTLK